MAPSRDPERVDPVDRNVPVDAMLVRLLRAVEREVDAHLRQPTSESLHALEEALSRLDAQTADSDAWIAGVTDTASWGVDPKGTVIGETGNVPIVEEVPGAQFNALIELVKAARQVVRHATARTVGALEQARSALEASRH